MLYNIQIENAFNWVLEQYFIAVGPFFLQQVTYL